MKRFLRLAWSGLSGAVGLLIWTPVLVWCVGLSWFGRRRSDDPREVWREIAGDRPHPTDYR